MPSPAPTPKQNVFPSGSRPHVASIPLEIDPARRRRTHGERRQRNVAVAAPDLAVIAAVPGAENTTLPLDVTVAIGLLDEKVIG